MTRPQADRGRSPSGHLGVAGPSVASPRARSGALPCWGLRLGVETCSVTFVAPATTKEPPMDLLTRIRNTKASDLDGVPSHFDDLPRGHFSAAKDTGMVRIVEGADDLMHPQAGRSSSDAGMVKIPTNAELASSGHNGDRCDNRACCPNAAPDARSPRQIELMADLHTQLAELDHAIAEQAVEYTTRMTLAGQWTPGREGNASRWIGNMIKKVRELRALAAEERRRADTVKSEWLDIPTGYYALRDGDSVKFYRVNHHSNGRTYLDAMASDERHPIRNAVHKKNILTAIRAMGWEASTALYGQEIGSCGRCGRTLTDDISRAAGIGPKCRKEM